MYDCDLLIMIKKGKDYVVRNESKNNNLKLLFLDDIYPILILFIQFHQIYNENGKLILKGNEDNFKVFEKTKVLYKKTLWCHNFYNIFDNQTKNIEMYEVETMKLYQILPFHYFDIHHFHWNQKQSSFIAFELYDGYYCVFERV